MWGFEGRTVLVTGASGGIGGATVRQLVAAGADVIASGRSAEALDDLAAKTGCRALPFDLASEEGVRAGSRKPRPLGSRQLRRVRRRDRDPDDHGHLGLRQGDQRQRERRLAGHQIRLAVHDPSWQGGLDRQRVEPSGADRPSWPYFLRVFEGALDNITRVSALELGKYNIRVNSVNPTVVMTEMSAFYWGRPEIGDPFLRRMPLGRWATRG